MPTYAPMAPNPYQGAPQPAYQAPGAAQASQLNQMLAGQGASVTPQQAAGFPASATALLSGLESYVTGPGQEALAGQIGNVNAQGDLTSQQLGLQKGLTQQEAGFSLGQLGVQGADLGLQLQSLLANAGPGGFQEQQRALTAEEQAQQFAQSQRALQGQNATSGSTGGNQVTSWSDLLKGYGFQRSQLALQGKEQQQAFETSRAQLANAGKSLGISEQEVTARLNNALAQYGLTDKMDANQIAQQVAALQQGYLSGAQAQSLQILLQAAGLPIQAFTSGG